MSALKLSHRERQLIRAVAAGQNNREIARSFGVSEQTVKNQLTVLYQKAGVTGRLQLAVAAVNEGLLEASE